MLSNKEKMLVTLAYYQGACDNMKYYTPHERHENLQNGAIKSANSVLKEFGLGMPNVHETTDLYNYMDEMEEITGILCKEDEYK